LPLGAVFVEEVHHWAVVWDKVDSEAHVGISVARTQHEFTHIRKLVKASPWTSPDLSLEGLLLLPPKALLLHQRMDLVTAVATKVKTLQLFTVLVKKHQVRVMMWNEVDLESNIGVSMSRLLYEAARFRQLVQTSSRA